MVSKRHGNRINKLPLSRLEPTRFYHFLRTEKIKCPFIC
ncbi:hypothetical protein ECMP0215527_1309 [Escherichia coli MP021552.7]|uniref:Uncharacterized protein n=1 Tax=Escherichia coli TaxID=562 RepID=A0A173QS89_ECOLX|nr:hypothetical protein ECMP0215527_1309 [Escherichia coli MP021552.7]CRX77019.1 hypothetical protein [Escherichia coli]